MARMVELIREGAAPASMMRRAAQGGLSLPAREAIEILVALAVHRELGAQAEQTLASWNEESLIEVASDALTPPEVCLQLLKFHGQRPAVVAALCQNPALALEELEATASQAPAEVLRAMMLNERVRSSSRLLELMKENPATEPARALLEQLRADSTVERSRRGCGELFGAACRRGCQGRRAAIRIGGRRRGRGRSAE